MEIFDGFISAVASEFKIKFHKDTEESYTTTIEFDNDRKQDVLITLTADEAGDRIINYYSTIGKLKKDLCELYKYSLQLNSTLDYGYTALLADTLVLRNSILLQDCDPRRFMKSLTYIAAKRDFCQHGGIGGYIVRSAEAAIPGYDLAAGGKDLRVPVPPQKRGICNGGVGKVLP